MSRLLRVLVLGVAMIAAGLMPSGVLAATPIPTTTTVTASPPTAVAGNEGGSIAWTINVTPDSGSGPVTGTGTYTLSGPSGAIATNTFNAGTPNITISASGLSAGTYTLTATYAGDATYGASSGSADGTFVSIATTTTVTVNPATAVAGSEGGSMTWTINVTRTVGGGPVTGTGTYTLSGPGGPIATNSFNAATPNITISASGFSAGTYTLTATYAGDSTYDPSSGSADGTFATIPTTTTVTVNPTSAEAGSEGGSMTWTINVTRTAGGGPVTGTGTYTLSGPGGPIATNSFNAATPNLNVSASGFSAGTYTLTASFVGDSTYDPSSGSADGTFVTVPTTTTVTASPATAPAGSGGGSITWTINVTRTAGGGQVAGTGTWTLSGPGGPIATNTFNAAAGVFNVSASGLSAGTYTVTASYPGDSTYQASSGSASGQFVTTTPSVLVSSSLNPSVAGQAVTFTAVVSGSGATPTGSVTFKDGSTTLGSTALDGTGTATLTTSALSPGSHDITATYSGDSTTYGPATSSILTQVVRSPQPPVTTATLAPAANGAGWNNTPVSVALSAAAASGGAPVAATYYAVDDPTCTPAAVSTCHTYTGPFSVSTDGVHTVTFFSVDTLGTAETLQSVVVHVDRTAPATTATPGSSPNGAGWYTGAVTVAFAASDATSGVDHTETSLDGGAWTTAAGSTTVSTSGIHTLAYRSVDRAGNVEAAHTLTLKLDLAAPVLTITAKPGSPPEHLPAFTFSGEAIFRTTHGEKVGTTTATCADTRGIRLVLTATDGVSTVGSITYSASGAQPIAVTTVAGTSATVSITSRGLTTFTGRATDLAGNASAPQRWAVAVGSSRPSISCAMPLGGLSIPAHGLVVVTGRIPIGGGHGLPFVVTFRY